MSQAVCGLLFIFKTQDGSPCLSSGSLQVSGHDWTAGTFSLSRPTRHKTIQNVCFEKWQTAVNGYPFKCRLAVVRARQGETRPGELPHAQRGTPQERDGHAVQDPLQAGLRGAELRGGVHGQQALVVQLRLPRFEHSHTSCLALTKTVFKSAVFFNLNTSIIL